MSDQTVLEPVRRLSRDIRAAALQLGDAEARFLVDAYYIQQDDRKRSFAQERALETAIPKPEPNAVIAWLGDQSSILEQQIKTALDAYTNAHKMGNFMRSVYGIGPVISAGLLAHIYMGTWCETCHAHSREACRAFQKDKKRKLPRHKWNPIEACPTVGHIYQFAGIAGDGQNPWEKGQKRPFNAQLKTLCWKLGQSFMKFNNQDDCIYGHYYREWKEKYIEKNDNGGFAEKANMRADKVAKTTDAWAWYNGCYPAGTSRAYEDTGRSLSVDAKARAKKNLLDNCRRDPGKGVGLLPPGHIDAMARRWAVKRFLADMHTAWYWMEYNKLPPLPYPVGILQHAHLNQTSALQAIPELWRALLKR